jgi:hypothetical protein
MNKFLIVVLVYHVVLVCVLGWEGAWKCTSVNWWFYLFLVIAVSLYYLSRHFYIRKYGKK